MTEAVTTNAAVIAMRSASVRRKVSSGDMVMVVILRRPRKARASKDEQPSRLRGCRALSDDGEAVTR